MAAGESVARLGVTALLAAYIVYRVGIAFEKLRLKQTSNAFRTDFRTHLVRIIYIISTS